MVVDILDYECELKNMEKAIFEFKSKVMADINDPNVKRELSERIGRCEWYIQGQIYHLRNMIKLYKEIVSDVTEKIIVAREQAGQLSCFFTGNDALPNLYYELYAFINLLRISLDYFHRTLSFKFENGNNLPKSFSAFASRATDCPILERLANDSVILYFKDFRDCLNHYRTFSVNRLFLLIQEDVLDFRGIEILGGVEPFILKPAFRIEEKTKIIINFYLPDLIFEGNGNKLVSHFTYEQKKNIIAETMNALRHILFNFFDTLSYINRDIVFHYNKNKFEKPVKYVDYMN